LRVAETGGGGEGILDEGKGGWGKEGRGIDYEDEEEDGA